MEDDWTRQRPGKQTKAMDPLPQVSSPLSTSGSEKTRSPFFDGKRRSDLGKGSTQKKRFLSGIARMMGGGLPMPEFFGPLSISAFLVNKKSLFLQKCQCIELLTVF